MSHSNALPVSRYALYSHPFTNQKVNVAKHLVVEEKRKPFLYSTFCRLPVIHGLSVNQNRCCSWRGRKWGMGRRDRPWIWRWSGHVRRHCGRHWPPDRPRYHRALGHGLRERVAHVRRKPRGNTDAFGAVRPWLRIRASCRALWAPGRPDGSSVARCQRVGTVARLTVTQRAGRGEI